jgi:hypothetical protein
MVRDWSCVRDQGVPKLSPRSRGPRWLLLALLLSGCGKDAGGDAAGEGDMGVRGSGGGGGKASAGGASGGSGTSDNGAGGSAAGGGADGSAGGSGGADAPSALPDTGVVEAAGASDGGDGPASPGADAATSLRLESEGFYMRGGDLVFYASACYPKDQSPPFSFLGVPAGAKSLAFTFVDRSNGATKWVVWDIPPGTTGLPARVAQRQPARQPGPHGLFGAGGERPTLAHVRLSPLRAGRREAARDGRRQHHQHPQ